MIVGVQKPYFVASEASFFENLLDGLGSVVEGRRWFEDNIVSSSYESQARFHGQPKRKVPWHNNKDRAQRLGFNECIMVRCLHVYVFENVLGILEQPVAVSDRLLKFQFALRTGFTTLGCHLPHQGLFVSLKSWNHGLYFP